MHSLQIENYRAIKEANIRINGITVLAGINGCGKSTISRWLYYLVNATNNFEHYQRQYLITSLVNIVEKIYRIFLPGTKAKNYKSIRNELFSLTLTNELDENKLKAIFDLFTNRALIDLRELLTSRTDSRSVMSYILETGIQEQTETDRFLQSFIDMCSHKYDEAYGEYIGNVNSHKTAQLNYVILREYSEGEAMPDGISLKEGNGQLVGTDTFHDPLLLRRAIYIDSPMAVNGRRVHYDKQNWRAFHEYLYSENTKKKTAPSALLNSVVRGIIGGDIQIKNDEFNLGREMRYISKAQGIDININDAATGIKTFAYVYQLLKNGWLDSETVLIIDEPEAHLHPQWVVEFARLIVLIHKVLKVKFLVASHNPDMVMAIQSIAQKEEVIDNTVFYLAERGKDETKYHFTDKGTDISYIFTSFNIALTRIDMYGN